MCWRRLLLLTNAILLLSISEGAVIGQNPLPAKKRISAGAQYCKTSIAALPDSFVALDLDSLSRMSAELHECIDVQAENLTRRELRRAALALGEVNLYIGLNVKRPSSTTIASGTEQPGTVGNGSSVADPSVPQSGLVSVHPLDLGQYFTAALGYKTFSCKATSAKQLSCEDFCADQVWDVGTSRFVPHTSPCTKTFLAIIISQGSSEFLLGCSPDSYDTCSDLPPRTYRVMVHGRSVTFPDSGLERINLETGKTSGPITPSLTVLYRLK